MKNKEEKNQVNEPVAEYGQPLNFNNVWLLFQAELGVFQF